MNRTLDPITASEPELCAWLATQPCPRGVDGRHRLCCNDSGLAFEWASVPCTHFGGVLVPETCAYCHGSLRVPKDVGLEELFEHGGLYFINKEWDRPDSDGHVWAAHARNKGVARAGRGETPTLAALRAVAKAVVEQ